MKKKSPVDGKSNPAAISYLSIPQALILAVVSVATFHLAFWNGSWSFLILVFLFCLFRLSSLKTGWQSFAFGVGIGLAIYVPYLSFFWKLFGAWSIALWLVLPFWLGVFLVMIRWCLMEWGIWGLAVAAPFVWTGLEYFRSELYYFRFSWLAPGYAFANAGELEYPAVYGVYGISFLFVAAASLFLILPFVNKKTRIFFLILLGVVTLYPAIEKSGSHPASGRTVDVAGIQTLASGNNEVIKALDEVARKCPDAQLIVMREAMFNGAVPDAVLQWCREHKKYLIVGGRDRIEGKKFYNTAYVVDADGKIAFRQAKCRPVQFCNDGLPAREQKLWNSPWGFIGIAICYDDGYRVVMDELVRQGAQMLVVPTMDPQAWGELEHEIHSRIVRMRAAEYEMPVLRLSGAGPSIFAGKDGLVKAFAPSGVNFAVIEGKMELASRGRLPLDRWVTRFSVIVTAAFASWFVALTVVRWRIKRKLGRKMM